MKVESNNEVKKCRFEFFYPKVIEPSNVQKTSFYGASIKIEVPDMKAPEILTLLIRELSNEEYSARVKNIVCDGADVELKVDRDRVYEFTVFVNDREVYLQLDTAFPMFEMARAVYVFNEVASHIADILRGKVKRDECSLYFLVKVNGKLLEENELAKRLAEEVVREDD